MSVTPALAVWDGDRILLRPAEGRDARSTPRAGPEDMDTLTVFGAASVGAMLLFYSLEERSPWAILGFALACWSSAIYGWLAGVWPFTVIEGIWGIVAVRRFARRR